ncbi:MAG: YkvA family protein [Anaerolineae bacterium]|nr:YkvA family protein [Anaerolineae bacterium]
MERWKQRAESLRSETYALYLACRDPRVPWYARALAGAVVAYALSPIDLIPDPIPVLGYLDDLVLVPLGIALVLHLIPGPVMAECRERATAGLRAGGRASWAAAAAVVAIWLLAGALVAVFVWRVLRP